MNVKKAIVSMAIVGATDHIDFTSDQSPKTL